MNFNIENCEYKGIEMLIRGNFLDHRVFVVWLLNFSAFQPAVLKTFPCHFYSLNAFNKF